MATQAVSVCGVTEVEATARLSVAASELGLRAGVIAGGVMTGWRLRTDAEMAV